MGSLAPLARLTEDHAKTNEGMSLYEMEKFLQDIRHQPQWRADADLHDDYYDGNQLDNATLAEMKERGIPIITQNLIAPSIDMILGLEARTRKDWIVRSETLNRQEEEVAEALGVKLKEAERMTGADRAMSEAFAYQIKSGLGWVEVGRPADPFEYKYRVKHVHRRDIWFDWRARELDLSDGRFLIRRKWFDKDYLMHVLPTFSDLINKAEMSGGFGDFIYLEQQISNLQARGDTLGSYRDRAIDEMEWQDSERDRAAMFEVWYKKFERGYVFRMGNDSVIEFDPKNERHKILAASKRVPMEHAVIPKIRLSWWIGPHRIKDMANPNPFNRFPYVPFIGKRESRTGIPYGVIRSMIPPQDEVNARRSKMMWLLSARRVITDADAILNDDHAAVQNEIARPDAYIKLNPERQNKRSDAFRVEDDIGLSIQQFQVYEDAKEMIQDVSGTFNAALGKETTGQSGVAIASLVEQGTQTLGDIFDNTQHSREQVGDMLLSLIREDLSKQNDVEVTVGSNKRTRRTVILNNTKETDDELRTNDVVLAKTKAVLDDVPSTPTHKAQMLQQFTEMTKSLSPELQAVLLDILIEMTDIPNKEEAAERVRQVTGQDSITNPEEMTEEERAAFEQKQQARAKQQALEDRNIELAMAEQEAKIEEIHTKIGKMREEVALAAEKIASEERKNADNNESRERIERMKAENERKRMSLDALEKTMSRLKGVGKPEPKKKTEE